ncbi:RND family efflux transporter MFP subunit [Gloeobacter kilaueensis JS1]|uniref:RND family efflux transporter MFP subunit n=2 Tax=Gloeobacter TaxID=33071 RepID=U5QQV5_GLOK1|nr:RND family efflux transporter MFP subunit [Gloeobacter kilaueensis JS1]
MGTYFRTCAALMVVALLLGSCAASKPESSAPAGGEQAAAATAPGTIALTEQMEKRAGIQVTTAQKRPLVNRSLFSSTIEAPTDRSGVVTASVQGVVTRVLADVGQTVARGQTLAYISTPMLAEAQAGYFSAVAKVQEAHAQVQLTDSRVQLARADYERESALYKKGISAQREQQAALARLDGTLSELAAAKSTEAAARSSLQAARARLNALRQATGSSITDELALKSPVSGIVVSRMIQPGQVVNPATAGTSNAEDHLFTITSLAEVWAMLEVPQSEVAGLKLGAPVQFTSEVAPGEAFKGRIIRLGETFDPQARTASVRVAIANPHGTLKPGMLVLAQAISGGSARPVLAVPTAAIQQIDGKDVVFVRTAPHRYRQQPVVLGERNAQLTQIVSGLTAGTEVVSDGSFVLKSEALKATLEGE